MTQAMLNSYDIDTGITRDPVLKRSLEQNEEIGMQWKHSVTICKEPYAIFSFFRNFENLPKFMNDVAEVRNISDIKSHWMVQMDNGAEVEWDAEITREIPGRLITWRSLRGAEIDTRGAINFKKAPAGRGTIVSLELDYSVPGGDLTDFAIHFGSRSPDILIMNQLKRLKALLETGEIPTTKGQPSGREEKNQVIKYQHDVGGFA